MGALLFNTYPNNLLYAVENTEMFDFGDDTSAPFYWLIILAFWILAILLNCVVFFSLPYEKVFYRKNLCEHGGDLPNTRNLFGTYL